MFGRPIQPPERAAFMLDPDDARALVRLFNAGAQSHAVDANISVRAMRRLVHGGFAEAVDAPKMMLTIRGIEAIPAALRLAAATPGATL